MSLLSSVVFYFKCSCRSCTSVVLPQISELTDQTLHCSHWQPVNACSNWTFSSASIKLTRWMFLRYRLPRGRNRNTGTVTRNGYSAQTVEQLFSSSWCERLTAVYSFDSQRKCFISTTTSLLIAWRVDLCDSLKDAVCSNLFLYLLYTKSRRSAACKVFMTSIVVPLLW